MDIVKLGVNLNAQVRAACRSAFWSLLSLLRPSRSGYRTPQCCLTAIKENEENSGVYVNFFFFLNGARQKKKKGRTTARAANPERYTVGIPAIPPLACWGRC